MTPRASSRCGRTARVRRIVCLLVFIALAAALTACGGTDADQVGAELRAEVEARADRLRAEVRRRRDRIRARIEEVLGQLEQVVPRAQTTSPQVRTRGRTGATEIDGFLTGVITSVDAYWTRTFAQSGLPTPSVSYQWVAPGERASTGCRVIADDGAAFYCPGDDTIYVAQRFAADLYRGVARGLPGERAGYGRAAGDFGVAYVVAHEYAHNLQAELGYFTIGARNSSKTFELQADCMAGSWGNSVYKEGLLQPGDVEEAMDTALAVGDFDVSGENHHGTPRERQAAWLGGFRSGDPSVCDRYVPR